MKAIIMSDSHGNRDQLLAVLEKHPDYEAIFHVGDITVDEQFLRNLTPHPVYLVRGNCDYSSSAPEELSFEFCGKKIVMCHGHRYLTYSGGVEQMLYVAKGTGADIFLFGHTHRPYMEEIDGMMVMNPGSVARPRQENRKPTYIVMNIDADGNFTYELCEMKALPY